uniref:Ovule protein n=1 Tax=Globodera pallida TaxID=36090 RepID=A0A183CGT9_GLOPA
MLLTLKALYRATIAANMAKRESIWQMKIAHFHKSKLQFSPHSFDVLCFVDAAYWYVSLPCQRHYQHSLKCRL